MASFFVGKADDLTVYDYGPLIADVYGETLDPEALEDDGQLDQFIEKAMALHPPAIARLAQFSKLGQSRFGKASDSRPSHALQTGHWQLVVDAVVHLGPATIIIQELDTALPEPYNAPLVPGRVIRRLSDPLALFPSPGPGEKETDECGTWLSP